MVLLPWQHKKKMALLLHLVTSNVKLVHLLLLLPKMMLFLLLLPNMYRWPSC